MSAPVETEQEIQAREEQLAQATAVCGTALKQYIAVLNGVTEESLFGQLGELSRTVDFTDANGKVWHLGVELVDKNWMFPLSQFNVQVVRDQMSTLCNSAMALWGIICANMPEGRMPRADIVNTSSRLVVEPSTTTLMAYNKETGIWVRDNVQKRIGFVWRD